MTWFQQSANETEANKTHLIMFIAVDFDFPSGHMRMWTGLGDLTIGNSVSSSLLNRYSAMGAGMPWRHGVYPPQPPAAVAADERRTALGLYAASSGTVSGITYTGVGDLGSITMAEEQVGMVFERKTYQLSGVDPSLVAESDIDNCFGRPVVEYFGFINADTSTLVATPEINWEGRMDAVRRVDGPSPVIEINAEHRLVMMDRTDNWVYSHQDQQQFTDTGMTPDDGFDQLTAIQMKTLVLGGQAVYTGTPRPHGGGYG